MRVTERWQKWSTVIPATVLVLMVLLSALTVSMAGVVETDKVNKRSYHVDEIIIVFKTHFDIGYTDLPEAVIEKYRTGMIDMALDRIDESRGQDAVKQFVWTIPGWPMAKILDDQPPERAARLADAMERGRFAVHAIPFTMHTETLVEEDLVRGLRFASKVNRLFGKPSPDDAKMTDVPCHSWIVPTLLSHSGVVFMHEGTNSGCADPAVPMLYFREGPDGSRVLTMHVNGYGCGMDPPADWPWKTWLGLIHTGDNHGPPTRAEVDAILDECAKKYPGVRVRIGRLADFGHAILDREDHSTIPVVRGDMPDTWIHGPMSDPVGQRFARAVHEQLTWLELLSMYYGVAENEGAFTDGMQPMVSPQAIADAREKSLLYGEHTWGGALYWICNYDAGETLPFGDAWTKIRDDQDFTPTQRKLMQSWDEHTRYIREAASLITDVPDASPGASAMVFNPLPWSIVARDGQTITPGGMITSLANPDSDSGVVSSNLISSEDASPIVSVESPFYRVTLDTRTMRLVSLYDLGRDREILCTDSEKACGFLYQRASAEMCDRFMKDYCISFPSWVVSELGKQGVPHDVPEERRTPVSTPCEWSITDTETEISLCYSAAVDGMPFDAMKTTVTLSRHRPEILVEFRGDAKAAETWPEAGYFRFPLNIATPQFRLGRLGGIVDPVRDIVSGSNRHLFWLRTGIAVTGEDGFGVGICPLSSPLVSLGEPGCWKFSWTNVPRTSDLYFNLFNNQWTTNFRLWNEGDIRASFVLWTFDAVDNESDLVTRSLESMALYLPLPDAWLRKAVATAGMEDDDGGQDGGLRGISLSRKGIAVTAFGPDVDSGKLTLRLWEMAGGDGEVEVRLPVGLAVGTVLECDLRGEPLPKPPISVIDGRFVVPVPPYAPVCLVLEASPDGV